MSPSVNAGPSTGRDPQGSRLLLIAAFLTGVLGLALLAGGLAIPAKAWLAQILLDRAWAGTIAGAEDTKPWPWADTVPVARITLPYRPDPLVVLEGATGRSLAFAPGWVHGTARPGRIGTSVIAAHRDTHFAGLDGLRNGDWVEVTDVEGRATRFEVIDHAVMHRESARLPVLPGEALLALVTCWPLDAVVPGGPERLVVLARAESIARQDL